jgi:hypothetical protein
MGTFWRHVGSNLTGPIKYTIQIRVFIGPKRSFSGLLSQAQVVAEIREMPKFDNLLASPTNAR